MGIIGLNELLVLFAVVLALLVVGGLGTGTWLRLRRTPTRSATGLPKTATKAGGTSTRSLKQKRSRPGFRGGLTPLREEYEPARYEGEPGEQ